MIFFSEDNNQDCYFASSGMELVLFKFKNDMIKSISVIYCLMKSYSLTEIMILDYSYFEAGEGKS